MNANAVYYDPYLRTIVKDPYPVYKRLRDEAPVYYNKEYDFYAVSRYEDVRAAFVNNGALISSRGGILEMIKAKITMPAGTFIFEDPPQHTAHRRIVQRLFTPKRMNGLEPLVRELTIKVIEPLVARDEFDFIDDIGRQLPMRVIGMLLGIPESDQAMVREIGDAKMRTEEGKPQEYNGGLEMQQGFGEYIDWRRKKPSDDVITELLNVEFTDETGTTRKLTREELITFCNVLAGAGNETTNRLIGWTAKTLAEQPDQRRELVENPALIPDAIEEVLRLEPPAPHVGRYAAQDVEFNGNKVPAGSAILMLIGAANHDERVFPDPDRLDIHRKMRLTHLTFGSGVHTCVGNVLARLEGRVVFEELLKRIPTWDIDVEHARLLSTSTVRGWDKLPAYRNATGLKKIAERVAREAAADSVLQAVDAPVTIDGEWNLIVKGPTGPQETLLTVGSADGKLQGTQSGDGMSTDIDEIAYDAGTGDISWGYKITKPMKMTLKFTGKVDRNTMSGKVKAGFLGNFNFTATKR
jgi:cytochrome P450